MTHQVTLENFSGPLDLLLHLVRKNELDISTVSIAAIVDQYLNYMLNITSIDVDDAAEFLAMAATLMGIKARYLLPGGVKGSEASEEESQAHDELVVERLLEYRRYNAVAEVLSSWQEQQVDYFARGQGEPYETESAGIEDSLAGVSLMTLALVFKEALDDFDSRDIETQRVSRQEITLEQQLEYLLRQCRSCREGLRFCTLLRSMPSKLHIVTTFLAVLEAIRRGLIMALQERTFGQIILYPLKEVYVE